MAEEIHIETPWRRDPEELADGLSRWVARAMGPGKVVRDVAAPGNGMSSETVLFEVQDGSGSERYVARLAPLPELYPVFPEYDLELQRRCMDLVRTNTDVPAPEVPYSETDPSWLGTPFIVMKRIDGGKEVGTLQDPIASISNFRSKTNGSSIGSLRIPIE